MGELLYKYRSCLLLAGIFISYLLHASNGLWVDDFWDHSAVVTELIRHPWHPKHPQLGTDLPHVFFTPYSLLVAMVANGCHLSSIEALSLFGVLNASLLFYGLNRYIDSLNVQYKNTTFFYSVLMILFFWGGDPWSYSGFFHIDILNFSLPYPSSFATGLVFLAFAFNERYQATKKFKYLVFLYIVCSIVILTHAVAFIFLCVGLVAGTFHKNREQIQNLVALSVVLLFSLITALQWPYYPYWMLLRGAADIYHASNKGVYEHILNSTWPILISLPFLAKDLLQKKNRQILVALIILLSIYIVAWVTQKYSYGRVISYVAILIQIVLAIKIAKWDEQLFNDQRIKKVLPILIFILFVWVTTSQLNASASRFLSMLNSMYLNRPILNQLTFSHYSFLGQKITPDVRVLANIKSSWIIPSFGGKVITLALPHAFVKDHENRIEDVNSFYSENTTNEHRQEIIKKYQAEYIFLHKLQDKDWLNIAGQLTASKLGKLIYQDATVELYEIDLTLLDGNRTQTTEHKKR